jgi:hypothetical protein
VLGCYYLTAEQPGEVGEGKGFSNPLEVFRAYAERSRDPRRYACACRPGQLHEEQGAAARARSKDRSADLAAMTPEERRRTS